MEPDLIAQTSHPTQADADLRVAASNEQDASREEAALPLILSRLEEDQAQDVLSIPLEGKSDIADAMVIASGRSQRHVAAIADKIMRDLKDAGHGKASIEGLPAADWVLIDAGDVVVHLFRPEVRDFYRLERLWAPERYEPAGGTEPAEDGAGAPATDAGTDTGDRDPF